jgi:chaperonin cofactor prefoldin
LDIVEEKGTEEDEMRDDIKKKVEEIEERIGRINKIKRERGEVLKDLKEKVRCSFPHVPVRS